MELKLFQRKDELSFLNVLIVPFMELKLRKDTTLDKLKEPS